MKCGGVRFWLSALLVLIAHSQALAAIPQAVSPIQWIQPSSDADAHPIWGIKGGLSIGLWPTSGPRGLLRIYTPYLDQPPGRIIQFIAIEPIVTGVRGLSEIQRSPTDGHPGKPMWTADHVDLAHTPAPTSRPASGVIDTLNGIQTLSFYLIVEPFDNEACPIIKVTLRGDLPHEVSLQTFAASESAPMESCVLTATMGNYARLRHLNLKNQVIHSTDLFRNEFRNSWQFFPWHSWSASNLPIDNGNVIFSATGDIETTVPSEVPPGWRYEGMPARQYWRTAPCPGLTARVNGRTTFWGTEAHIPGGAAFENFELKSPYSPGQVFYFGIDPVK